MTEEDIEKDFLKADLKALLMETKEEYSYLSNIEVATTIFSSFEIEDIKNIITELKKLCKN
jgi:hypothetical protein